jgi:ribose/xylose/arabinose/galactoside ABC-type transport system permease subunit
MNTTSDLNSMARQSSLRIPGLSRLASVEGGLLVACLVAFAGFSRLSPGFLTEANLQSMAANASVHLIVAVGLTLTILARGIDVSVGSIVAMASVLGAGAAIGTGNAFVGVIASCVVGLLIGIGNGLAVAGLRLSPLIVTLATLGIFRGLALLVTEGQPVSGLPTEALLIGTGALGPVPYQTIVAIAICLGGMFVLHTTRWGTNLYCLGANPRAAAISGVPVRLMTGATYALSGLLAGLAGAILTSRLGIGSPLLGNQLEFVVLPMVFLGGVAFMAGRGTLLGVLLAVVLMTLTLNGMLLFGLEPFWQQALSGAVLVVTLVLQRGLEIRRP